MVLRSKFDRSDWQRCNRTFPCPICGKPDWCLRTGPEDSPTAAICARIESDKRVGRSGDGGGWLHRLRDDHDRQPPRRQVRFKATATTPNVDCAALATRWSADTPTASLNRLADELGLSAASLMRLSVGWSVEHRAWSFPMRNTRGAVCGIRLRLPDGRKLSVRGGKEGLFVPDDLPSDGGLLIAEGPTDTAALLDLDFAAVGRPSCAGGLSLLVELIRQRSAGPVVIVADVDSHGAGQRGAETLATVLLAYSANVRIITPPDGIKDARQWKRQGATHSDLQAIIDAAPLRRLTITRKAVQHG